VVAGERELYQRFADYDDEELLRILTAERAKYRRAKYRREALAAVEMVLMQRGVAPPPVLFTAPGPPAPQVQARQKSPYQFIDVCVDALLAALVYWALQKLWVWTQSPRHPPQSDMAFLALAAGLLWSVISLRRRWRTKEWRD
jgi:hypothetical protein